jgi:hypothetical protein
MSSQARIFAALGAMIFVTVGDLQWGTTASAQTTAVVQSIPSDRSYSEYVPPVGPGGVGATLYPCPRPTPPLVGHTYITYQPLAPHEFLYPHARHYRTWHEDGRPTRTSVHWGHSWLW